MVRISRREVRLFVEGLRKDGEVVDFHTGLGCFWASSVKSSLVYVILISDVRLNDILVTGV